jgi:hypothetical protein
MLAGASDTTLESEETRMARAMMKALVVGQVVDGSSCYTTKAGEKRAELRVFDGAAVNGVRVDPKFVEGPDALRPGTQVRIMSVITTWNNELQAESCNGVEVVAGGK